MEVQEITFKCDGNKGSFDDPNNHSNYGDTIKFTAGPSTGGVKIWNLPTEVFADASPFELAVGESIERQIRTDAQGGVFTFAYKCLGCSESSDNIQHKVNNY